MTATSLARAFAALLAATLVAGCAGTASIAPARQGDSLVPSGSPGAAQTLAAGPSGANRKLQHRHGDDEDDEDDDGGRGELHLPALVDCGNGTLASDCTVWSYGTAFGRGTVSAPALNFCRDAARYPSDLATPATPLFPMATYAFTLRYLGTSAPPIASFATRPSAIALQAFIGTQTSATIVVVPAAGNAASRGWLVFFTAGSPADVLLIPYAINEIQVPASESPLTVPSGGATTLGAFDCLGETITAQRFGGAEFGFSSERFAPNVRSANAVLAVPVYGGANPRGFIRLSDDAGARTTISVN